MEQNVYCFPESIRINSFGNTNLDTLTRLTTSKAFHVEEKSTSYVLTHSSSKRSSCTVNIRITHTQNNLTFFYF